MTFKNINSVFNSNEGVGEKYVAILERHSGKEIKSMCIDSNDRFVVEFVDDSVIAIYDDGHSCCEHRYMHSEDELDFEYHAGSIFRFVQVVDGPDIDDCECHETKFCNVLTDKGVIQLVCHNEHNGYYGGFSIAIKEWRNN